MEGVFEFLQLFLILQVFFLAVEGKEDELPLDSGPESFQSAVPAARLTLPSQASEALRPRTMAELEDFEAALASLPGYPAKVRKKFSNANPESLAIAKAARAQEWGRMFGIEEALSVQCPVANVNCNPWLPIRSADGTCNNLVHPLWGSRHAAFSRLLIPPKYEDGRRDPRGAVYTDDEGYISRLPSPRVVSTNIMMGSNTSDALHSHMFMQFGQFLDHDLSANSKGDYDCCNERLRLQPQCFNIDVKGDQFYGSINRTCMDFSRSNFHCGGGHDDGGNSDWIEQFNEATSFLDGSQVYGSTKSLQMALRHKSDGLLATNRRLTDFLPTRGDLGLEINEAEDPEDFVAGDGRVMSQPTLLSLHVLWLREHNRIASRLKTTLDLHNFSDHAKDEVLFQESRKIVNAEMQSIVYGQFLPEILSSEMLDKFGLRLNKGSTYFPEANPTLRNEFSTAANRYGHSQVQDLFEGKGQPWRLGKFFGDVSFAIGDHGEGFEKELEGAVLQNAKKCDRFVTKELMNNLFNNKKMAKEEHFNLQGKGYDLLAINTQRGRDHGLGGYNAYRSFFGLERISSMDQRPIEIAPDAWQAFQLVYRDPDDIDLFVGGLSETPMQGGLLGPTFSYIIADQFKMLKDGDRFFFTHSEGPKAMGLALEVQDMLLQRTLSDIICQNTQDISQLPKNVFLQSDIPVSCEQRPDLDFNAIARILNSSRAAAGANNTSQAALVPPEYPKTEDEEEQEENKMGHETTYANENYFSNDSRYASAETGKQENNEKEDREEEEEDNSQEPTKDIYLNRK